MPARCIPRYYAFSQILWRQTLASLRCTNVCGWPGSDMSVPHWVASLQRLSVRESMTSMQSGLSIQCGSTPKAPHLCGRSIWCASVVAVTTYSVLHGRHCEQPPPPLERHARGLHCPWSVCCIASCWLGLPLAGPPPASPQSSDARFYSRLLDCGFVSFRTWYSRLPHG